MNPVVDGQRAAADWRPQQRFVHSIVDSDQLDQLNDGGGIAVRFSPAQSRSVHIAFAGSQSDTLSVWQTNSAKGFISAPKSSADLVTIRFVDQGAMSRIDWRGADLVVGFDQALLSSFEAMRCEQATPGFSAITATVRRDAVIQACRVLSGADAPILPQFDTVVDLRTSGLSAVRATVLALQHRLSQDQHQADLMNPLLEEVLLYQLVGCWPAAGTTPPPRAADLTAQAVRRAVDYIEGNLGRRIAIQDIAAAAGLSVRALQIAFKQRVGCSPVHYLIGRRLDRVHSHLQIAEGKTIRQIASLWGFVHMSDFARRYRERFGSLPSARDPALRH